MNKRWIFSIFSQLQNKERGRDKKVDEPPETKPNSKAATSQARPFIANKEIKWQTCSDYLINMITT